LGFKGIVVMMNRNKLVAVGSFSALASVLASQAQAEVPAAVTTAITTAGTDIATIGAAILGLAVVAMTFRWLKATFF
jgi:Zn-dependent alcohol dehydrogenase